MLTAELLEGIQNDIATREGVIMGGRGPGQVEDPEEGTFTVHYTGDNGSEPAFDQSYEGADSFTVAGSTPGLHDIHVYTRRDGSYMWQYAAGLGTFSLAPS